MRTLKRYAIPVFIALVTLWQSLRLFVFIDHAAVNLLSGDDFDDLQPLFQGSSWWQTFRYQWGPRRLGVGLWVLRAIYEATAWNTRTLSFAMGAMLVLSTGLALWLKWRLFKRWHGLDALIPLIVLNLHQWEILLYIPQNGIILLPLLLASALLLTYPATRTRDFLFWLLSFVILHTGYGIFAIVPVGVYWLRELTRSKNKIRPLYWGFLSLAAFAFFMWGYRSEPGLSCFQFPYARPWEYFIFQGLTQSFFFGLFKTTGLAAGVAVFLFFGSYYVLWRLLCNKKNPGAEAMLYLLLFSLVYQFNAAIGRVCLGTGGGKLSRYVTFQIPQMLALLWWMQATYLQSAQAARRRVLRSALGVFTLLVLVATLRTDRREQAIRDEFIGKRQAFHACFMSRPDLEFCADATGHFIYPDLQNPQFRERYEYLRQHRVNLFKSND